MKNISLLLLLTTFSISSPLAANTIHLSPEIKIGPYVGSGISGGGLQIGLVDLFAFDAVYVSYTKVSSDFLYTDKDEIETYRIGVQYQFVNTPKIALQVEAGTSKYSGSRKQWIGDKINHKEGEGVSLSASWVLGINEYLDWRAGVDFNHISSSDTFLTYSLSATLSTGFVISF